VNAKRPQSVGTGGAAGTIELAPNSRPATPSESTPAVPIRDKLVWNLADIAALTGLSRRLLERELAAARLPRCDLRIGRRTLWRPATITAWLESLADHQERRSKP
jgi:hypothetical protein